MKTKDFLDLLSDAQDSKSPTDINTELGHSSDTNADSPESLYCNTNVKGNSGFKEETCPSSPETSFYDSSKDSNIEDNMLELMLGLKHLSLKNSNMQNSSRSKHFLGSLQSYSSRDAKCPESVVDETTSKFQFQEQHENLPSQYLTQLAAKPFFCECQGCTCEFVTREALLMHYVKKHNYSKEMVLQLNMFQHRYSPFKCHICQRSFTRKTHLRIHYRNKHQIGCERVTHKFDHVSLFTDDMHKNSTVPTPVCATKVEYIEHSDHSEQLCHPKKEECSSETDLESGEETDNVTRKSSKIASLDSHREELEAREGRGSKRTVAKGNLCYILHKYHKPFHCIHKSCNSAFTNQKGLIRHYRTVHQYNKEQLCLEKDKARTKRELVKCKKIFACKHKECGKRFLCSKDLAKHCSDFHNEHLEDQKLLSETESARFACNQAQCPAVFYTFNKLKQHLVEEHASEEKINKDFEIHCDLNGCDRVFTNYSHYSQHVYFRHSEYYDSLFGNQKEEEDNHDKNKNEQSYLKDTFDINKQNGKQLKEKSKRVSRSKEKHLINFKTKEEALQMCKEKSNQTQYPCMVQGCLSVVKLESSILRHYKRTHQMTNMYIEQRIQKLVVCVKCGIMIEKQTSSETALGLDKKGIKVKEEVSANPEYVQESEKCLVPNSDCEHQDVSNEDQKRNSVSFDTGAFTYSGTLKYNHSSKTSSFEEHNVRESVMCRTEDFSENSERENSSYFSSLQLELPREKDTEGCQHSAVTQNAKRNVVFATKDKLQKPSVSRPFDLKTYKPMGFESSFLKFIQESEEKDDDDDDFDEVVEWESPEQLPVDRILQKEGDSQRGTPVNSFVDDKNVIIPQNNRGQLTEIQPLLSESSSAPSLENLRAILDKALTDCGDLALKQLHYLRPVVVLERSKFSTSLIDLFPTKKADELCVGST